jgi:DNA-binding MarR family transcriptional regulator
MSRARKSRPARAALRRRLALAGRDLSDAVVMFHTALGEKLGLAPSEWKMLGLLERHGPMTPGDLSARSGLAPPSVTGIIDRLERRAWVRRDRDTKDARRVVVTLDQKAAERDVGEFFGGLIRRLEELYEQYADEELERLAEVMVEIARCQREATAELQDGELPGGTIAGRGGTGKPVSRDTTASRSPNRNADGVKNPR